MDCRTVGSYINLFTHLQWQASDYIVSEMHNAQLVEVNSENL